MLPVPTLATNRGQQDPPKGSLLPRSTAHTRPSSRLVHSTAATTVCILCLALRRCMSTRIACLASLYCCRLAGHSQLRAAICLDSHSAAAGFRPSQILCGRRHVCNTIPCTPTIVCNVARTCTQPGTVPPCRFPVGTLGASTMQLLPTG